jgi:uncharacterized protein (TIGR02246 family)
MNATGEITAWIAQQACRDLVVQAAACIDAQDYEAFAALFLPDGELQRPGDSRLQGRAAILAAYRARPADRITRHVVTNMRVDLESESLARVSSLVLLWSGSLTAQPGPFGRPAQPRRVLGEFEDRLLQVGEGWRIARRIARFVLVDEGTR